MKRVNVHVVTHTHWDREWYAPFEIFKGRLFNLIDGLIENLDKHSHFKHFMLDGQTVILEDYLKEHSQNREKLVKLIKDHRVIVGPWYMLPDEFLVTGEAVIRNFLIGQDVLKSLGVPGMQVGYLPDMFGHSAYMPSILKGLGLKAAVIWRGVGDACKDTEFVWKSPNGDEILTVNLIHAYFNGAHFGRSVSEMKEVFPREIKSLSDHKTTNNVLIMNGIDHEFPLYELPKEFSFWAEEFKANLIHSTVEDYVDAVTHEKPSLKEVYGELKDPKYEPVLKDVTSTRIYLKLLNFDAEQLFTRYVEPLSAYLWLNGRKVNINEINEGWKLILKSQPHDSICGCSVDAVHRDVESRLRNSIELGSSLVAKYMREISNGISTDPDIGIPILVFNPYEHQRNSIVTTEAAVPLDKVYEVVDEKGKNYESFMESAKDGKEKAKTFDKMKIIKDYLEVLNNPSGFRGINAIKYHLRLWTFRKFILPKLPPVFQSVSGMNAINDFLEFLANPPVFQSSSGMGGKDYLRFLTSLSAFQSDSTILKAFSCSTKTLAFQAELPPLGFKVFYLKERKSNKNVGKATENPDFENDFYAFHLNDDGSFDLRDKGNDVIYKSVNYFEDVADAGDEYNFSPLVKDKPLTNLGQHADVISVEDHGFLKKITIEITMKLPKSLDSSRKLRAKEQGTLVLYVLYKLYRDRPGIDVELVLNNTILDHKLSFVVNLSEKLEEVKNDGYFGMVFHPADIRVYDNSYAEEKISRYAMESFAALNGNKSKLVVATRGIHEYESHLSEKGTSLNFTLLRSVGWLSRGDLLTRREEAGPEIATPEAQCIGEYRYHYSFTLLKDAKESEGYKAVRDFLLEPVALQISKSREQKDTFPAFPQFTFEDGAFLSAFKISQDGEFAVMRWNNVSSAANVAINSVHGLEVRQSNMGEKAGKRIASGKKIVLKSEKDEIKTALIRLKEK